MGKAKDVLHLKEQGISIVLNSKEPEALDTKVHVIFDESLNVPPFSEIEVMATVSKMLLP